ncbi:Transcription factor DIVARICATA [Acorus gramineus]|uniref:Transcription factor DIVARICATA n=1 Tax=Acorus gramineus TaxID=55184 RepID=A0AAV9B825_ACOGR|nr:Transcription factor DIVARICATA [Acorus gramineus]
MDKKTKPSQGDVILFTQNRTKSTFSEGKSVISTTIIPPIERHQLILPYKNPNSHSSSLTQNSTKHKTKKKKKAFTKNMDSSTTNNLYCLSPQFSSISSSSLSGSDGGDALVPWTKEENKAFETAVAEFEPSDPHRWEKIASRVPGRTVGEVQRLYELLEDEMEAIVSDMVGVPDYVETMESVAPPLPESVAGTRKKRKRRSKGEPIRKGVQWTEEEHRYLLLFGLILILVFLVIECGYLICDGIAC